EIRLGCCTRLKASPKGEQFKCLNQGSVSRKSPGGADSAANPAKEGYRATLAHGKIGRPSLAKPRKLAMFLFSLFMQQLEIKNLRVAIGENEIIRDLSLSVGLGELHAVMGPNGSGKSTLAKVIAGHPDYKVTSGEVFMDGENLFELEPDERARKGLFLAFQYPSEVPGVTI